MLSILMSKLGSTGGKVAHPDAAAKVDAHPPLETLMDVQVSCWGKKQVELEKGEAVIYWMRMEDMRS